MGDLLNRAVGAGAHVVNRAGAPGNGGKSIGADDISDIDEISTHIETTDLNFGRVGAFGGGNSVGDPRAREFWSLAWSHSVEDLSLIHI